MVHLIRAAVVSAALLVSVLAGAQDRISVRQVKDEFNLQIGVMSSLYDGFGNYSRTGYAPDLYDLYEPYSLSPSYSPVVVLDYGHYLTNRFKLGIGTGFSSATSEMYNPTTGVRSGERHDYLGDLMGQVKFVCLDVFNFKIHCGAAAGGALKYTVTGSDASGSIKPAFEIVPFGIMWTDHKVYGIAETAFGTRMNGIRIGLGYRF